MFFFQLISHNDIVKFICDNEYFIAIY